MNPIAKLSLLGNGKRYWIILLITFFMVSGCSKSKKKTPIAKTKTTANQSDSTVRKSTDSKTLKTNTSQYSTSYTQLSEKQRTRAKSLFTQHCAECHGEKGDGQTIAARFLFPKPRDFRSGHFRLVTTENGVPLNEDLEKVLARGMPGSSMPPWPAIRKEDLKLLAEQVIEFRREGIRAMERATAADEGEDVDEQELHKLVQRLTTPSQAVKVASFAPKTPEAIQRGKKLYVTKGCVGCHGEKGRGDGQEKMVDVEGLPTRPRDLTKGIFKGSPDYASIYRRTQAGMPGSPMPAAKQMTPQEVSDLVHFVLSLSDEATRKTVVMNRETITAKQVVKLPAAIDSPVWNESAPVRLRMTPLWWRDDFEPFLEVRALHDGTNLSFLLSWKDITNDQHAATSSAFEDAVALEIYRGDAEPFLGMGVKKTNLDVWMWDADRQNRVGIDKINPNIVVDNYPFSERFSRTAEYQRPATKTSAQPKISSPAKASGNPIVPGKGVSAGSSLITGGPGTVKFRPPINQTVKANGVWKNHRWNVVMTRSLKVANPDGGFSLQPGAKISVAFAVWNGSQKDRDGKKLITIWQDFVLEKK